MRTSPALRVKGGIGLALPIVLARPAIAQDQIRASFEKG